MSGAPRQLCPSCGTLLGHATVIVRAGSQARSVARHRDLRTQHTAHHRDRRRQIHRWTGSPGAGGSAALIHDGPAVRQTVGGMLRLAAISTLGPFLFPSLRRSDAALTSAGIFSEPFLLAYPKGHPAGAVRPGARSMPNSDFCGRKAIACASRRWSAALRRAGQIASPPGQKP